MRKNWLLLTLLLTGLAGISYADLKFFWLDRPTSRDNKFDPASPNYLGTSTPTGGGGGGGATATDTRTLTPTPSDTPGAGPTNTPTQIPTPSCVTVTKNITLLDFESAQYSGDWGWSGVTSGTQLTMASPLTRTGNCSPQAYQVMVSTALTTGQSSGVDVNFNPLTAVDVSSATIFRMAVLAPQGMNGTVFLSNVSGGTATFKISSGSFSVPASPNWQLVSIPAGSFTVTVGGSGAWTPTAGNAVNDFTLEVDGPTAVQTLGVDDVGFVTGAAPTPTPTATVGTGGSANFPLVYNGDTVALGTNFYGAGGSVGAKEVTAAGAGAGGSNTYMDMTLSSAAGGYSAAGVIALGFSASGNPLTANATAYTSLSISVRVPGSGGCIIPAVSVLCYNVSTGLTKTSASVDVEPYLMGGAQFLQPDTWYTAVIPVAAFSYGTDGTGFNGKPSPNSATITATDLQSIDGVEAQPYNYGNSGAITGEIYVDDIVFNNAASSVVGGSAGKCLNCTDLFADFENGTAGNWGGYWSANVDAFTATDCPTYVAPPGTPNLSSLTYNGVTDTAGAAGSSTPCHDGHLAGWLGAENGQWGTPACTNVNAYPYLNESCNLTNDGSAHDLSSNSWLTTLPAMGATGLKFKLKLGPNMDSGQSVKVFIERTAANKGSQYFVQIGTASLSSSSWTSFTVPFPADGFTGSAATDGTTCHTDQGAATELTWLQPHYSSAWVAWGRTDFYQLGFGPLIRGKQFDVYIDDIQFY